MPEEPKSSADSIIEASKSRASFSKHGGRGAAGYVQAGMDEESRIQDGRRYDEVIKIEKDFSKPIKVGISWNNIVVEEAKGFFNKLIKHTQKTGVDIDLGCLYELEGDRRGALQGFGELFGAFDKPPFIRHFGDERTGDKSGYDEELYINTAQWDQIKRVLIYCYIYGGPESWDQIKPRVGIYAGDKQKTIIPEAYSKDLAVCALGYLENVGGDVRLTALAEYYRSHASMDRAFGFGLRWQDGEK